MPVSEAIALKLRRPGMQRPYLYPQIFAGSSYILASMFLFALDWNKAKELRRHTEVQHVQEFDLDCENVTPGPTSHPHAA